MGRPRTKPPPKDEQNQSLVAYYRVSTDQQGRSGLGLEAQREAVARYVVGAGGRLVAEYQEVESGKRSDRPQLRAALAACRARRAALVVAKLDRLARNTRFLLSVAEGTGEHGVVFCDLPQIPPGAMGKFFVTLMAAVAELEAGLISQRTKAALEAAKARGIKLGGRRERRGDLAVATVLGHAAQSARARAYAADVLPYIDAARQAGALSLREIAAALVARGIKTPSGGERWQAEQVRAVLRLAQPP
jgi:DNA invertase Pin-like site-specific DNA recombinase